MNRLQAAKEQKELVINTFKYIFFQKRVTQKVFNTT